MAHDGASQLVVTSFVALQDGDHQLQHVIKGEPFLQLVDVLSACLDQLDDKLARVAVDEHDP